LKERKGVRFPFSSKISKAPSRGFPLLFPTICKPGKVWNKKIMNNEKKEEIKKKK
jgi:hypothetical protein